MSEEMCGVRVVVEREDKFEVDPDWVMPPLVGLCRMVAVLNKRCAGSTTPISTHQVLVCSCLESRCGVGSEARRRVGS